MSANQKTKRNEWDANETQKLLDIWATNVSDLRKTKRNAKVFEKMVEELHNLGVNKTKLEIINKIKNLTKKYREEKKLAGTSGGSPSEWRFFGEVHQIIGSFPANDDSLLSETINLDFTTSPIPMDSESDIVWRPLSPLTASNRPPKKKAKRHPSAIQEDLLQELKRSNAVAETELERCSDLTARSLEVQEKLLELLTKNN